MVKKSEKTEKECTRCRIVKPIAEFRAYKKRGYVCRKSQCLPCERESNKTPEARAKILERVKRYQARNKEELRRRRIEARRANPEAARERDRRGRERNPEAERAKRRRHYERNAEYYRAKAKEFRRIKKEQISGALRSWRDRNREHIKAYRAKHIERERERNRARYASMSREQKRERRTRYAEMYARCDMARRARLLAATVEEVDRLAVIERDNATCYLCGTKLNPETDKITLDHVIPLTRGGSHSMDNLKVACVSCNTRKSNKLLSELEWVRVS